MIEICEEFVGVGADVIDGARGRIEGVGTYCCGIEIGGLKSSTGIAATGLVMNTRR